MKKLWSLPFEGIMADTLAMGMNSISVARTYPEALVATTHVTRRHDHAPSSRDHAP